MAPKVGKKGIFLAKAAVGVASIGLLSKLLGFSREVVLARYFGATEVTDAYLVAVVIPVIVVGALINAITATFIPVFAEYKAKRGEVATLRLVNNTLNLLLLLSVLLGISGYLLAPQVVSMLAPGFHGSQVALTVRLTRIIFPAVFAMAIIGLAIGVLQSRQCFWVPAAIGLPYNLTMIIAIILSSRYYGIIGVAVGTVLATFSQALFQIPFLYRSGFRYRLVLDLKEEGLRKMAFLIWPVLIGIAATQMNTIIDRWLASTLPEGSISALNYGFKLVMLPLSLVVSAVNSVTYPFFSQMVATNQREKLREVYLDIINIVVLFFVPITVGMIILREPFVRTAFQRGAFDASDTTATTLALLFYSVGLVAYALNDISSKVFFAVQDTKTPVLIGMLVMGFNVILNFILVKPMAHSGLALATSIASIVGTAVYFMLFRRRYGFKGGKRLLWVLGVSVMASAFMGLAVLGLYNLIPPTWTSGNFLRQVMVLSGLASLGAVMYLTVIKISRLPEGGVLFEIITRILSRTKSVDYLKHEVNIRI